MLPSDRPAPCWFGIQLGRFELRQFASRFALTPDNFKQWHPKKKKTVVSSRRSHMVQFDLFTASDGIVDNCHWAILGSWWPTAAQH
jgi:hypothetical protein